MTQRSLYWTNGLNHGGPYTQDDLRLALSFMLSGADGVIVGALDALTVYSTGNNNVRVRSGRALVNGTIYENDAEISFTTASPTVGTTGRRLVLRKDWTAGSVTAAVLSSADGTEALPALTQNAGTVWEISLASFTITTGGVIGALTDTRILLGPVIHGARHALTGADPLPADSVGTTQIANAAVATAKLAAGAVTTTRITDNQITTAKLVDLNVTTAKIADAGVTTAKIADLNVTEAKLANGAVTTGKITNQQVTDAKIADGHVTPVKLHSLVSSALAKAFGRVLANGSIAGGSFGISSVSNPSTGKFEITFATACNVVVANAIHSSGTARLCVVHNAGGGTSTTRWDVYIRDLAGALVQADVTVVGF
jgi:hypothetical protein